MIGDTYTAERRKEFAAYHEWLARRREDVRKKHKREDTKEGLAVQLAEKLAS